ncbi:hypothetical protein BDR03DRAFT_956013 [Suillus americanus]|nr:hypothetical protein BDR03DRAFT_956013 [Suillus americanus]
MLHHCTQRHRLRSHKNDETRHSAFLVTFQCFIYLFMKLITLAPQSTIDILGRVP